MGGGLVGVGVLGLSDIRADHLARLLRTRKVSAVEVMRAYIAQIERGNPKVNAIVTFLPEAALKEAKKLDAKRSRSDHSGPLAGPPIAPKENIATAGTPTPFRPPVYPGNIT